MNIFKHDRLSAQDEIELSKRWLDNGDKKAVDRLIACNLSLVAKIAGQYMRDDALFDVDDLINEGVFGLMEAAKRYDWRKGVRFSTYSAYWIKAYIQYYVMLNCSSLSMPKNSKLARVMFGRGKLLARLPEENKTDEGIADYLGMPAETLAAFQNARGPRLSTDAPVRDKHGSESTKSIVDFSMDVNAISSEDAAASKDQFTKIMGALELLTDKERDIIESRYFEDKTLEEVGATYGVSRERIRQIEAKALDKIREVVVA